MTAFSGTEIVDIAKQVESAGEAFYEEAIKHAKNEKVREVFAFLHAEEKRHGGVFEGFLANLAEAAGDWRQDEEIAKKSAHTQYCENNESGCNF